MRLNNSQRHDSLPPTEASPSTVIPTSVDIDEAIDLVGLGRFQKLLQLAAGLAYGADAAEVLLLSFLTPVLQAQWGLSSAQAATIFSSVFAGQVLGALVLGPLCDRFGRRPMFLLTSAIITVFGFLTAVADSYAWVLFFRLVTGLGIGGLTIPFDLSAEFLPVQSRGRNLLWFQYFWTLGELWVVAFAYATLGTSGSHDSDMNGWRKFVALAAIPVAVSVLLGAFVVPESPRWLLSKGRGDEALAILRRATKCNGNDPDEYFPEGIVLTEGKEQEQHDVRVLLSKTWRKTTILIWISWACWSFGYFGNLQLTTKVFSHATGESSTYSFDYVPIVISALAEFLGTIFAYLIIDRVGRVKTQSLAFTIGGFAVLALALSAQVNGTSSTQLAFSLLARFFLMAGIGTCWVMTPELLPTGLRATGHSAANFWARVGGFASPYLVDSAATLVTSGSVILAVLLVAATAVWGLAETKGKALGTVVEHEEPSMDEGSDV